MNKDDTSTLTQLGSKQTDYPTEPSGETLETFPNPHPDREYQIRLETSEFSSRCPKTDQPDFATIIITYCPKEKCIESKSLKLYLQSYRDTGAFMENLTNQIMLDLTAACKPLWMIVQASFNARGGITTEVEATYNSAEEEK